MKTKHPYFHQENGQVELRIPLNAERAALIRRIISVSGLPAGHVARTFADWSVSAMDHFAHDDLPGNLAIHSGKDYATIFAMLERFHGEGWLEPWQFDLWKRELEAELRERVESADFETPDDVQWARGVLATV